MTHLVWDWNGTLLDDLALVVDATNASLAVMGGPPVDLAEHRRTFCRPVVEYYNQVLGRPLSVAEFQRLDMAFHDAYLLGLDGCQLAVDALTAIAAWPGTQSLLSMWTHRLLVREVRRRGLTGLLTRIDGKRGRPIGDLKATYLVRHLAALGVDGADCVLIGDSIDDADAAAAVGAGCVLYAGGITDAERLATTGLPVAETLVAAVTQAIRIAGTPAPPAPAGAERRQVAGQAS